MIVRGLWPGRTDGGGLTLASDSTELRVTAVLPSTRACDDVLTLVRSRVYRCLSIEFVPETERMIDDLRVIESAPLLAVAVVDTPAYPHLLREGDAFAFRGLCCRAAARLAMHPSEGQLQALFEIPADPVPPEGSSGVVNDTGYNSALAAMDAWARSFRPETGLGFHKYNDVQLARLARTARSMLAAELLSLDSAPGEESDEWTDGEGTVFRVRKLTAGVFATAVSYLVRALYYDGVSKGDYEFWSKVKQFRKWQAEPQAGPSQLEARLNNLPDVSVTREREFGPAGTGRMIEKSGALRMIAPYARRRLVEVL